MYGFENDLRIFVFDLFDFSLYYTTLKSILIFSFSFTYFQIVCIDKDYQSDSARNI